jgi:hypothetical protein
MPSLTLQVTSNISLSVLFAFDLAVFQSSTQSVHAELP